MAPSPRRLRELITEVPLVVDAGLGTARAMELGFDAVLLNTAIAGARNPVLMASAMRDGVVAGRKTSLARRMPRPSVRKRELAAGRRLCLMEADNHGVS